jgi:hypothetical protein
MLRLEIKEKGVEPQENLNLDHTVNAVAPVDISYDD